MSKNVVINIIMFSFLVIIIGLIYLNFFEKVEASNVTYKQYCDELIEINDNVMFDIDANFIDKNTLAILAHSQENTSMTAYVNVSFFDESGKEVGTQTASLFTFPDSYGIASIQVPKLDGKNAGKVEIQIAGLTVSDGNIADVSKISYETSGSVPLTLIITNQGAQAVSGFGTEIVAFRDKKIIGFASVFRGSLSVGEEATEEIYVFISNNGEDALQYDDLLIFTSSANIG